MRKILLFAVLGLSLATVISCKENVEEKIIGRYEMTGWEEASGIFDFGENGKFTNIVERKEENITMKVPGTWHVSNDSLFFNMDYNNIEVEDTDDNIDEEILESVIEFMKETFPERYAYKIVSIEKDNMKLDTEGTTFTFKRK